MSAPADAPSLLGDIVFQNPDEGDGDIWTMKADGSGRRPLIALPGADGAPDLSPDGTRLTWIHSSEPPQKQTGDPPTIGQVMVANTDGSGVCQVTPDGAPYQNPWGPMGYGNAQWSPDGSRILFTKPIAQDKQNVTVSDVFTVRPDGSDTRVLFSDHNLPFGIVDWSPDGTRLAVDVHFYFSGGAGIYVIDLSSGAAQRVSSNGMKPSWSPDSQHIVFAKGSLAVVSPDGSETRDVFPQPSNQMASESPAWSEDGSRIFFLHGGVDNNGQRVAELKSIAVDGSDLTVLGPGYSPGT